MGMEDCTEESDIWSDPRAGGYEGNDIKSEGKLFAMNTIILDAILWSLVFIG